MFWKIKQFIIRAWIYVQVCQDLREAAPLFNLHTDPVPSYIRILWSCMPAIV